MSITQSTQVSLGGFSSEIATNRAAQGDYTARIADALIVTQAEAEADLTTVTAAAAAAQATADAGMSVVKRTVTITQAADLAGLGAGVKTFDKNVGAALPANARVLAAVAETVTDFDDATHGTYVVTIGTSAGGSQIGTSLNVAAGQSGFPKAFTAGAQGYLFAPNGTAQLSARITSSVDLNTATAGAITVNVFYLVLA